MRQQMARTDSKGKDEEAMNDTGAEIKLNTPDGLKNLKADITEKVKQKIRELDEMDKQILRMRAALEEFGFGQLTEASDVTEYNGLVLPAREKNPNIPGTLQNQIARMEKDLGGLRTVTKTYHDASGSFLLDCFPQDQIWYMVFGSVGIDNVTHRVFFTTPMFCNGNTALRTFNDDAYISVAETDRKLSITLHNITTKTNVSVQALCLPYF